MKTDKIQELDDVLRSVMFAADSAAIDAIAQGVAPHQVTAAAVHAAIECALGNGLIQITDPKGWPEYFVIDPPCWKVTPGRRVRWSVKAESWDGWLVSLVLGTSGILATIKRDDGEDWVVMARNVEPIDPPTASAPQGDRPRFWWSPSQALIRGGSRDTVPADAVELVPRTAVERPAVPADDEAAQVKRMARAIADRDSGGEKYDWNDADPAAETERGHYEGMARAALAALKEGQA